MFAILAFLKLAQKMDSLLQSLGLNVTQTGGRAVGDLIMAGMALKHVGNAVSKGMGMFGLGGKSGGASGSGSGTGSGVGTRNASGRGSAPIPASGPGGIPTSRTSSGGVPTGSTAPSGAFSSSTTPPNPSTPSGTSGAEGSHKPENSRNPIGKATDWMKQDGFAQGAVKAGAKGGLIGLGVYSAKSGMSKVSATVSAGISGNRISSDPHGEKSDANPVVNDIGIKQGFYHDENLEDYQMSKPINAEDQAIVPSSFYNEDYKDSGFITDSDDSGSFYSSFNDEDYKDTDYFKSEATAQPIPSAMSGDGEDSAFDLNNAELTNKTNGANDEVWQSANPVNPLSSKGAIPPSVNNEEWQSVKQSDQSPSATPADSISGVSRQPLYTVPFNSSPFEHTQNEIPHETNSLQSSSSLQNSVSTTPIGASSYTKERVINPESTVNTVQRSVSADAATSKSSSEGSSITSSISSEPSAYEGSYGYGYTHDSSNGEDNQVEIYDSVPVSTNNQAMPDEFPIHDAHAESKMNRADFLPDAQTQEMTVYESTPVNARITGESQSTQINNDTKTVTPYHVQPAPQTEHVENQGFGVQPSAQPTAVRNDISARPTDKGSTKYPSAKGRKRKR
jgi:hypothetical protein